MSQGRLKRLAGSLLLAAGLAMGATGGAERPAGAPAGGKPSLVEPGHVPYLPLPEDISTSGAEIDSRFRLILWLTGGAFLLTEGLLIYALLQFRHIQGAKATPTRGNLRLEIAWTVAPGLILLGLVVYQLEPWRRIQSPTAEETGEAPVRVQVLAMRYEWNFRYAGKDGIFGPPDPAQPDKNVDDIYEVKRLIVPKGRRVVVELRSTDVIHGLFLPHMRFKQDVVPGMTVYGWFQATKTTQEGRAERNNPYFHYEIACTELCGPDHGAMRAELLVLEPEEFERMMETEFVRQQELEMPKVWDPRGNRQDSIGWYSWTAAGKPAASGAGAGGGGRD